MKKIALFTLVIFSFGLFAAQANLGINGSIGFQIAKSDDNTVKIATLRPKLVATNGDTTLIWLPKYDASSPLLFDYLFVDTKALGGMLRIGKQRLGMANFYGGVYKTSQFCARTAAKGEGLAYTTEISGMMAKFIIIGNMFLLDNTGAGDTMGMTTLGALINVAQGANVALLYHNLAAATSKSGMSVYADYTMMATEALKLMAAVYYDLSDEATQSDAFNVLTYTMARQMVQVMAKYMVEGMGTLYLGYTADLNSANAAKLENELVAGAEVPLNADLKAVFDFTQTTVSGTASSVLTAALDFALM